MNTSTFSSVVGEACAQHGAVRAYVCVWREGGMAEMRVCTRMPGPVVFRKTSDFHNVCRAKIKRKASFYPQDCLTWLEVQELLGMEGGVGRSLL